jgi:glutamate formiminotransferase/formiminotetrahydrofolate cyclodeaminase
MSKALIECVPNISEGRDQNKINQIVAAATTVEGVQLLDVDPGKATNRTVITLAGDPDQIIEAAFQLIKRASELIDMSQHQGEHPRMGATDVCPLIPISGISMEETVKYAHKLGKRVGDELGIPGYFYENAALTNERKNLANNREGEYEGLVKKLSNPKWKPDFGTTDIKLAKKTGATNIGARDFLVAYNINLNTTSTRRANAIAFDIRERGRVKREGDALTGKIVTDESGQPVNEAGSLKCVKGIGWYIEEYGIAQLSLNLTNISVTPVHIAFDEACEKAALRGVRVTGSELVGLIPLKSMLDAGKYFLKKQERSVGVSDEELVKIAVKSMGLDELSPFNPKEKIIEYVLDVNTSNKLINKTLLEFINETASESPAPGGGSISAYVGALGAALGTMVANLSSHKRGWDARWETFSDIAEEGQSYTKRLLHLVDEDTLSFNRILEAFKLPKNTKEEEQQRTATIEEATKYATSVPLQVMKEANASIAIMKQVVEIGMQSSLSDGAVGAMCARTAVMGAFYNVKINAKGLKDRKFAEDILQKAEVIAQEAISQEKAVLALVDGKL